MLISYSIKNFKSISNKLTLNFVAKNYKETKLKPIDDNLLPLIGIYGPNGGGKSSIIQSWQLLELLVSSNKNDFDNILNFVEVQKHFYDKNIPIEWELEIFSYKFNKYKYKLKIDKNEIIEESLEIFVNNEYISIFFRDSKEIKLNKQYFADLKLKDKNYELLIVFLSNNIDNEFTYDFFQEFLKIHHLNNPFALPTIPTSPYSYSFTFNIGVFEKHKNTFLKFFKEVDINIIDYYIDSNRNIWLRKQSRYGEEFTINFLDESTGTQKIIQLMCTFIIAIHNGETWFIDEIDSSLHPKLLGYILKLYHDKNNSKAQLIFSSHDMYTFSPKYLRKDEIYLAAQNENYFTDLICLSEFKQEIREKSSYSQKYLKGELGYDPYISSSIKIWGNK